LPDVEPVLCTRLLEWADQNPELCETLAKLLHGADEDETRFSFAA
jgi:hypothetical protein